MLNVKFHKFPFKRSHNDVGKEGNSIVTFVITLSLDAVVNMLMASGDQQNKLDQFISFVIRTKRTPGLALNVVIHLLQICFSQMNLHFSLKQKDGSSIENNSPQYSHSD